MYYLKSMMVVVMMVALADVSSAAERPRRQRGAQSQPAAEAARLDEPTRQAILEALADEREAKAFYRTVLDRHGERRPFSHLVEAEARHESALLALAAKYNVQVPEDRWLKEKMETPETLSAAVQKAIEQERENVAMYDRLLKSVEQEDIRKVMNQLRQASEERHLPALERPAAGGLGRGPGGGGCCGTCCGMGGAGDWDGGGVMGGGRGRGWRGGR